MPRAEDYEHLPIEQVHLQWQATSQKGQKRLLSTDIAIHPNSSGKIIINYPGFRGDREGFNDKHRKLAQYMQGENLGAVVRSKGPGFSDFDGFTDDVLLRKVLVYSLENAQSISGLQSPEVFLIGTSAGAGAAAAIAFEFKEVTRMLLMAPGANIGMHIVAKGLRRFTGEVFVVIGAKDENVGLRAGQHFYNLATAASKRELFVIPNCDHQFRGEQNGKYMSQAPFYAFANGTRPKFPDPEDGMVLY